LARRWQTGDRNASETSFISGFISGRRWTQRIALAPPAWAGTIADAVTWCTLAGNPLIRRTWAVWPDDSRRRDLAAFVAALDITAA
jgi:hypothetical protein